MQFRELSDPEEGQERSERIRNNGAERGRRFKLNWYRAHEDVLNNSQPTLAYGALFWPWKGESLCLFLITSMKGGGPVDEWRLSATRRSTNAVIKRKI